MTLHVAAQVSSWILNLVRTCLESDRPAITGSVVMLNYKGISIWFYFTQYTLVSFIFRRQTVQTDFAAIQYRASKSK
jgi:hypothetical protein